MTTFHVFHLMLWLYHRQCKDECQCKILLCDGQRAAAYMSALGQGVMVSDKAKKE